MDGSLRFWSRTLAKILEILRLKSLSDVAADRFIDMAGTRKLGTVCSSAVGELAIRGLALVLGKAVSCGASYLASIFRHFDAMCSFLCYILRVFNDNLQLSTDCLTIVPFHSNSSAALANNH